MTVAVAFVVVIVVVVVVAVVVVDAIVFLVVVVFVVVVVVLVVLVFRLFFKGIPKAPSSLEGFRSELGTFSQPSTVSKLHRLSPSHV